MVARGTLNPLALVRIQARQPDRSPIAQSVEQAAVNREVVGSSPTRGANLLMPIQLDAIGIVCYTAEVKSSDFRESLIKEKRVP